MGAKDYAHIGEYSAFDMMVIAAGREVNDGEVVFAGTGLPMLAIKMAQLTNAPSAVCIYESGSIDGRPLQLPTSVGDARCGYQGACTSGLIDVFGQLQSGRVDLAFLGGAEIDVYGNINCSFMGSPAEGYVTGKRLTGGGGNPDIHSMAKRSVLIMPQEKRRFVDNVSYITSPGWRIHKWPGGEMVPKQEIYGEKYTGGPYAVISDMGVFRFDKQGRMYLDTVHPGFTPEQVKAKCGFNLNIDWVGEETKPPTYAELDLLYQKVDPERIVLP